MLNAFLSIFKTKKKLSVKESLEKIDIGNTIKLKFKDPKTLGLIDNSNFLSMRYDVDDLESRQIIGTLLSKHASNGLLFIEVGCFKMSNGSRRERVYSLMSEEIEVIQVLN